MADVLTRTIEAEPGARVRIAAAGTCMQLALGAVYGWSVFLIPLEEQFGATRSEVNLTFTITLAVLGIIAGFGGILQRRIGPRAAATIAGVHVRKWGHAVRIGARSERALHHSRGSGRHWPGARLYRPARSSHWLVSRSPWLHHRLGGHGVRARSIGYGPACHGSHQGGRCSDDLVDARGSVLRNRRGRGAIPPARPGQFCAARMDTAGAVGTADGQEPQLGGSASHAALVSSVGNAGAQCNSRRCPDLGRFRARSGTHRRRPCAWCFDGLRNFAVQWPGPAILGSAVGSTGPRANRFAHPHIADTSFRTDACNPRLCAVASAGRCRCTLLWRGIRNHARLHLRCLWAEKFGSHLRGDAHGLERGCDCRASFHYRGSVPFGPAHDCLSARSCCDAHDLIPGGRPIGNRRWVHRVS